MELNWKCHLTDLGNIRERGGRSGMILSTPSGEVFIPLTVTEVRDIGGAGLLFHDLRVTITFTRETTP